MADDRISIYFRLSRMYHVSHQKEGWPGLHSAVKHLKGHGRMGTIAASYMDSYFQHYLLPPFHVAFLTFTSSPRSIYFIDNFVINRGESHDAIIIIDNIFHYDITHDIVTRLPVPSHAYDFYIVSHSDGIKYTRAKYPR